MSTQVSLTIVKSDCPPDQPSCSGNNSTTTINADSLEELARMLDLAGVKKDSAVASVVAPAAVVRSAVPYDWHIDGAHDAVNDDGSDDAEVDLGNVEIADESADYGNQPTSRKGHEYDVTSDTHRAQPRTHYVPARSGDNPLDEGDETPPADQHTRRGASKEIKLTPSEEQLVDQIYALTRYPRGKIVKFVQDSHIAAKQAGIFGPRKMVNRMQTNVSHAFSDTAPEDLEQVQALMQDWLSANYPIKESEADHAHPMRRLMRTTDDNVAEDMAPLSYKPRTLQIASPQSAEYDRLISDVCKMSGEGPKTVATALSDIRKYVGRMGVQQVINDLPEIMDNLFMFATTQAKHRIAKLISVNLGLISASARIAEGEQVDAKTLADTYHGHRKEVDHGEALARTADDHGVNGEQVEKAVRNHKAYEGIAKNFLNYLQEVQAQTGEDLSADEHYAKAEYHQGLASDVGLTYWDRSNHLKKANWHMTQGNAKKYGTGIDKPVRENSTDSAQLVSVPVTPSLDVLNAGWRQLGKQGIHIDDVEIEPVYHAMIAKARNSGNLVAGGFVQVPMKPSLDAMNAGWRELGKQGIDIEDVEIEPVYHAMISQAQHASEVDEAHGYNRRTGQYAANGMALLPVPASDGGMVNLDGLGSNPYARMNDDNEGIVVLAIEVGGGKQRLTYASSAGKVEAHYKAGERVLTYHDQSGAERPGKILFSFDSDRYQSPEGRKQIEDQLRANGMDPKKKYSLRVFK